MDKNKIIVFDTTLRDGEQSPGCSMNTEEKLRVALQLEKLGVDVIEAGFAAASPGDFDAVSQIAKTIKNASICSLSRAIENDIKQAGLAVSNAPKHRIHTFIATSPIHMKYKLKMSPDEVIKRAVHAVEYARTFVDDVEFSLEDAGRSEISFMKEVMDAVISAGARTINLPKVDWSLNPENANNAGFVWTGDYIMDPEAPDEANEEFVEMMAKGYKFGEPANVNTIVNGFVGVYKPVQK